MKDAVGGAWLHDRIARTAEDTKPRFSSEDFEAYVRRVALPGQPGAAAANVIELKPVGSIDLAPSATCTTRFLT